MKRYLRLKQVSPLVAHIIRSLFGLNYILGFLLIVGLVKTKDFFIVTDLFSFQFWGILYILVGTAQLVTYMLNSYKGMRASLMAGFTLQTFWLGALAARQVQQFDSNAFLLILFGFIALVKFGVYLYFPDRKHEDDAWTQD